MTQRGLKTLMVLIAVLCVAVIWAGAYLVGQRRRAQASRDDLAKTYEIVRQIESLRTRPALASDREQLSSETTSRIEAAAGSAGITAESLVRIAPDSPARVGDTAYKEKPTLVTLRDVTLEQFVKFVHQLLLSESGLRAKSLRLTSDERPGSRGAWSAEVVFSYLIYEPPRAEK